MLRVAGLWWRVVKTAYLRYGFGGGYLVAAAIAFYSVVCIGPLALLFAAAAQAVLGSSTAAYGWVTETLRSLGGGVTAPVMAQVDRLIAYPSAYVTSLASVGALFWAGHRLFGAIARGLADAWPSRPARGFVAGKLISVVMMVVAGGLLGSLVIARIGLAILRGWLHTRGVSDPALVSGVWPWLVALIALAAFWLLYKFVPSRPPRNRVALVGAVFATAAWSIASPIFTGLMTRTQSQSAIYGGLAGVVLFAFWALLGAQILLGGGHIASSYEQVFYTAPETADFDAPSAAANGGRSNPKEANR